MGSPLPSNSPYCSFQEAANRLNRSVRQVRNYITQGFIRQHKDESGPCVHREDVEQMAISIGSNLPPMNRQTFFQMSSRLQKLEEEMSLVRRMLDLRGEPLRLEPDEAKALYLQASKALAHGLWSKKEISMWIGLFARFDEMTLEVLEKGVSPQAWETFYRLCLAFMKFVKRDEFSSDLEWQLLHRHLDMSRKQLRDTVLMASALQSNSAPKTALFAVDSSIDDLARRLRGK